MTKRFNLVAALALALSALPAAASPPSELDGLWRNPKGSVTVRIGQCGPTICGRVVGASASARAKAAQGGTEMLIGTTILSDIRPVGAQRWKGRVFLPKQNMHAQGNLRLSGNQLTVQGCVLGFLCKDQTWVRVS